MGVPFNKMRKTGRDSALGHLIAYPGKSTGCYTCQLFAIVVLFLNPQGLITCPLGHGFHLKYKTNPSHPSTSRSSATSSVKHFLTIQTLVY